MLSLPKSEIARGVAPYVLRVSQMPESEMESSVSLRFFFKTRIPKSQIARGVAGPLKIFFVKTTSPNYKLQGVFP